MIRSLIKEIKRKRHCTLVLTFFSTSGYNAMQRDHPDREFIDHVFLLPIDTSRNAHGFVSAINPQAAIFSVSDIWINYIRRLSEKDIPSFLISANIKNNSVYFHWYGKLHRHTLMQFKNILVSDDDSLHNLIRLNIGSGIKTGNALFTNAISTAESAYEDTTVERFCKDSGDGVFIAGSISDKKDLQLMSYLANNNQDTKFIFVPHEISEEGLNDIKFHINSYSILYSECGAETDLSKYQVLIIDFIGALAKIYRYGKWAYVGGGFTKYLHSVVEPAAYGIPMSYGPCTERQITAQQFQEHGMGTIVRNKTELNTWFRHLKNNKNAYETLRQKIIRYTYANRVSEKKILNALLGE